MPWVANRPKEFIERTWLPVSDTVLVSITEPGDSAQLQWTPYDTLRLQFDDVERKHPDCNYTLFSSKQAALLAKFLKRYRGKNIMVHCAAGISRSGAVVETILEAFPEYVDEGWDRSPNGHVKALLKRAMGLVPLGA